MPENPEEAEYLELHPISKPDSISRSSLEIARKRSENVPGRVAVIRHLVTGYVNPRRTHPYVKNSSGCLTSDY